MADEEEVEPEDRGQHFSGDDTEFDIVTPAPAPTKVEKAKKRQPDWDEQERLINQALPKFQSAYKGQAKRITAVIKDIDPNNPDMPPQFWTQEVGYLTQSVLPFYGQAVRAATQSGSKAVSVGLNWDQVNTDVLKLAHERAEMFAQSATDSSKKQLSQMVEQWVKDGGTMPDLINQVSQIWDGPRPDTAAVTEVTNLFAEGNRLAWRHSNVVKGYRFHTAHDDHVCPYCEPLDGQIFDLEDTEHLPAIHGGCRCGISPVVKSTSEIFGDEENDSEQ